MPLSKVAAPDEPRCDHMGYWFPQEDHLTQCPNRTTYGSTKCDVHSPERIAARGPNKKEPWREALRRREAELTELVAAASRCLPTLEAARGRGDEACTRLRKALEPYRAD